MQDGANYYSTVLEARLISFDVYIQGESRSELVEKRNEVMRVFNPKLGMGTLYYYDIVDGMEAVAKKIECVTDGEIIYGEKLNAVTQKVSITMLAPNPTFSGLTEYENKLIGFVGGLEMPYEMPFLLATQGDSAEIDYDGDADAPLLIEFRGEATRRR